MGTNLIDDSQIHYSRTVVRSVPLRKLAEALHCCSRNLSKVVQEILMYYYNTAIHTDYSCDKLKSMYDGIRGPDMIVYLTWLH